MRAKASRLCTLLATALPLAGATVEIHSEFLRVDPQGEVLVSDRTPNPREILSPGVVRNGYFSFQIVVRTEKPDSYFLFVGQNPANVLRPKLYKEKFVERDGAWIPDTLEPFPSPNLGVITEGEAGVTGQTAATYLLDVWVPPDTPVSRVRLELELKVGTWIITPLEVRILPARVPNLTHDVAAELPEIVDRSDAAVLDPFLRFLSQPSEKSTPKARPAEEVPPRNIREVIRRNAEQDIALARTLNPAALIPEIKKRQSSTAAGSEWYLSVRDLIYRQASKSGDQP